MNALKVAVPVDTLTMNVLPSPASVSPTSNVTLSCGPPVMTGGSSVTPERVIEEVSLECVPADILSVFAGVS